LSKTRPFFCPKIPHRRWGEKRESDRVGVAQRQVQYGQAGRMPD